ncbi:hypothetical protein [Companilactobacillus hulinensis]|uniref:hypothetical protein n=1 Tax=Companilactobacillus hulinensis TaxID=2486007 RepID=UPI000F78FA62|nr:hypothetical protein [Companilactobacillus hulinensis]
MILLITNFFLLVAYVFGAIYLMSFIRNEKMKFHLDERWYKIRYETNQRMEDFNHILPLFLLLFILVAVTLDLQTFKIDVAAHLLLVILILRELIEWRYLVKYDRKVQNNESLTKHV